MADRSSVAGDLICAIELLLLLPLLVVVGDAGRAALHAIFISITRAGGMSASSFSAYLVSSGRRSALQHCWEQYIKRSGRRRRCKLFHSIIRSSTLPLSIRRNVTKWGPGATQRSYDVRTSAR